MVMKMASENQELVILQSLESLGNGIQHECLDGKKLLENSVYFKNNLLNILHLNIRSIHKNFNELVVFLRAYNLEKCDIIILSESFECYDNQYNINGFTMHFNNGKYNRNDGVVIFIKNNLVVNIEHFLLIKSKVTISNITFEKNNHKMNIMCAYRPPNTNKIYFLEDLEFYLKNNKDKTDLSVFLGDININILNHDDNTVNSYLSILNHFGFLSCINTPTRVTFENSSCLDHIFIRNNLNKELHKINPYVIYSDVTDHYPVMLCIKNVDKKQNLPEKIIDPVTRINDTIFCDLIKTEEWNSVLSQNEVKPPTDEFYKIISNIRDRATYKQTNKNRNTKRKPWITHGIILSIKNRDQMKKTLLKNYNEFDDREYKQYRNNLKKIIEKCKHDFYKNKIKEAGNNLKKVYEIINEATDSSHIHEKTSVPPIKKDSNTFPDNKSLANYCNSYFVKIGIEMFNKIQKPLNEFNLTFNNKFSIFLNPVDNNEIITHINSLKNDSAPGMDMLNSKLIKKAHMDLIAPLVHIINLIFNTGIVPEQFKTSIITPIFKTGDKSNIGNYRPISLINNFSKIFEKCLKTRLIKFLYLNDFISKNQYGFLSGVGTVDALHELTKTVTDQLERKNKCISVFLDLAKAFDTVPHDLLLEVLCRCGVRGTVHNVFRTYLTDRQQFVRIGNTLSDPEKIMIGVPQGTVLGPILFITYLYSLTNFELLNGSLLSFADDTAAIFYGKTWEETKNNVLNGIKKIKDWLDTFKLSLNVAKTNYIAFSHNDASRPDFKFIDVENLHGTIKEVSSTKYLGVIVDEHLKWDLHVAYLAKNIRKLIYKFYTLREILSKHILISVYKAIVESLIRYGIVVWGGLYNNALKPLNVVQNYLLKVMYKKNKLHSTKLLYSYDIFDVRSIYVLEICSFVFKNRNKYICVNHTYSTRGRENKNLQIPNNNSNINLRFINYLAPKILNLIPLEIKNITKYSIYKKRCRKYIYDNNNNFKLLF